MPSSPSRPITTGTPLDSVLGSAARRPPGFRSGGGAQGSGAASSSAIVVIVWLVLQDHLQKERVS